MDFDTIGKTALASLRDSLDHSKFTADEWAVVERCVNRLANIGVSASAASPGQLETLVGLAKIDLATLGNFAVAKELQLVGRIRDVVNIALKSALSVGLKAIAGILVV